MLAKILVSIFVCVICVLAVPSYLLLMTEVAPLTAVAIALVSVAPVYIVYRLVYGISPWNAERTGTTDTFKERAIDAEQRSADLERRLEEQQREYRELARIKEQFREAAFYDKVTKLPNRNYVVDVVESLLAISRENHSYKFAVLYVDVDQFKKFNNSFGQAFGDKLLVSLGERLGDVVKNSTIVANIGGDDFSVIVTDVPDRGTVKSLSQHLHSAVGIPFEFEGREIHMSATLGVVHCGDSYETADEILRDANIALYQAKQERQPFVVFDKSMHDSVVERTQIEADLRKALDRNELHAVFQPIVNLKTGQVEGFESLVRWIHPKNGELKPERFIGIAEDTGLIKKLTEWILLESLERVKAWNEEFGLELFVSVNLSSINLAQTGLLIELDWILSRSDFDPSLLKIEITERAAMDDAEATISTLDKLRDLGIGIAIDDFGTGYSSLSYLHKFPIDAIKIDRSFVNVIESSPRSDQMVQTIISMANILGLDVIAEGVETEKQFRALHDLKCSYAQGFYFSRPLNPTGIVNLLDEGISWEYEDKASRNELLIQPSVPAESELKIN